MADVVTFDPTNLRIVEIDTGGNTELTWQEIYSEWKDWLLADSSRKGYPQAFRVVGGDPISETTNLGSTFFLLNRWKFRPAEYDHQVTVVGNLFTEPSGESPFVPSLGGYTVVLESRVSNLTEIQTVEVEGGGNGGSGATVADIWNAGAASYTDDDTMGGLLNSTVKKPVSGDNPIYEGTWMAIELVDVDQIVTEDDLNTWLGGHVRERLGLSDWTGSSKHARQYGLNRTLESLRRRNPKIMFSDLVYPQELSDAIKYGAAEHLYQLAMTGDGDVHDAQRKIWEKKFDNEMNGLMVTVASGDDIPAGSVSAERR
jgi:hypothetical protein